MGHWIGTVYLQETVMVISGHSVKENDSSILQPFSLPDLMFSPLLQCSLRLREDDINVLYKVELSTVTYF